jgi:hypothetical protein
MNSLSIQQMTWEEKLRTMEELWDSLRQDEGRFESPAWHEAELQQTAGRHQAGLEQPVSWAEAKRELLKRVE